MQNDAGGGTSVIRVALALRVNVAAKLLSDKICRICSVQFESISRTGCPREIAPKLRFPTLTLGIRTPFLPLDLSPET